MELSHRYAALLTAPDGMLREAPADTLGGDKSELEFQAHWFAGDFGSSFLTATTGERVEIVQFGVWNHDAGPDFSDAAVRFPDRPGAPTLRGAIELDTRAEDWERHGHGANPAFDDVILHLYLRHGTRQPFTRTSRHRQVAQVQLDRRQLDHRPTPPGTLPAAKMGRCHAPLSALPREKVQTLLAAAAQYRMETKHRRWQRLVAVRGYDQALFQSLAVTLGYKENKLPFALLAQRLPLKVLRAEPAAATGLLLGLGGFLHAPEFGQKSGSQGARDYLRANWEHWWPQRAALERLALAGDAWKLAGIRPANHPQRRLAALAQLARRWPEVRALIDRQDGNLAREVTRFLTSLHDPFWDHHYTLSSEPTAKPLALIGATRATEMLANVFFPLAIAVQPARWEEYQKLAAVSSNRRVKTAVVRLFNLDDQAAERSEWTRTAAHQQGILQIYEDFCLQDDSGCENCPFPERVGRFEFRPVEY